MTIDMSQFYQVFFDEAAEHLDEMERLLLGLDVDAPDPDDLNAIFRAAHSIKGGSGTFGFTDMTGVTHILETLLDRLRKNELTLRSEMVDAFLEASDVLRGQLAGHQNNEDSDAQAAAEVCVKLNSLASDDSPAGTPQPAPPAPKSTGTDAAPTQHQFNIAFTPDQQTLDQIKDIAPLFADLAALGKLEVTELPAQGSAPRSWRLSLQTTADEAAVNDVFAFFAQPEQVNIESGAASQSAPAAVADPGFGLFADDAPAESDASFGFFEDAAGTPAASETPETPAIEQTENKRGYGFFPPERYADKPPEPAAAQAGTPTVSTAPATSAKPDDGNQPATPARRATDRAPAGAQAESASIRVGVDKVDQLVNLVGELVITQAMLAQTASEVDPAIYEKMLNGLSQLERNTRDLQETVMSIRMMPISFVFSRFPRVVRDLASKLNKKVELVTLGEGTELDKGLIEKIADPLTHLVRNSLDHGIELPAQRIAAGKPAHGTITLQAAHQGGNVVISVIDDGAGLNRERILAKAREKGIPVTDTMPDGEVWQLIFAPGFSTADVVTDVSGRGVGMDVVRRNILAMGGQVDIDSSAGWGSRITIRLPLTLAILDGMSVAVGNEVFIIPLTYIVESLQPAREDIKSISGSGKVVQVRGEYLPLLTLYTTFKIDAKAREPHQGIVVIIESDDGKIALLVDGLVGQHQVVIKGLESNYRKVPDVSGATIMGDGRVALILDVVALVKSSQRSQHLDIAA
ncbi:MAG: chemotaxis protein CheA [Betaproteobacteria bacterium]|nr:chemotaxis protein CheA [Betaproteobacteria bacterium]